MASDRRHIPRLLRTGLAVFGPAVVAGAAVAWVSTLADGVTAGAAVASATTAAVHLDRRDSGGA